MTARADQPTGASGSTPREETVDAINAIWKHALDSDGTDTAIPAESAIAIASGLLYVGDQLGRLVDEERWGHEHDETDCAHARLADAHAGPKSRETSR